MCMLRWLYLLIVYVYVEMVVSFDCLCELMAVIVLVTDLCLQESKCEGGMDEVLTHMAAVKKNKSGKG